MSDPIAPTELLERQLRWKLQSLKAAIARPKTTTALMKTAERHRDCSNLCRVLGDKAGAREHLGKAASMATWAFRAGAIPHRRRSNCTRAMEFAVLCGDLSGARELAHEAVALALPGVRGYVLDRLIYLLPLPGVILGDLAAARERLALAPERPAEDRIWLQGTIAAVKAMVVAEDAAAFAGALDQTLASYHRRATSNGSRLHGRPEGYLCVRAAVLALLALRRGLVTLEQLQALENRRSTMELKLQQRVAGVKKGGPWPEGVPRHVCFTVDLLPIEFLTGS